MNTDDLVSPVEQVCVVCGSWTRSHRVPNGYVCHSCWEEHGQQHFILALDGQVLGDGVKLDDRVQGPPWAGGKFRLDKSPDVAVVPDGYDLTAFPHALLIEHPATTLTFEAAASSVFLNRVTDQLSPVELSELP